MAKTLEDKGKKPTGFTYFSMPNIDWMLRIIIWADPTQKDKIIEQTTKTN